MTEPLDWREGRDPLDVLNVELSELLTGEHVHVWSEPSLDLSEDYTCLRCGLREGFPAAPYELPDASELPDYAQAWDAMGRLVEAMRERGFLVVLKVFPDDYPPVADTGLMHGVRYVAEVKRPNVLPPWGVAEVGASAPEAAAKAALAALRGAR